MRREILTNLNTGGDLCQSRVVVARRKEHNKDEQPQHERRRRRTTTPALFFSLFLSPILGLSHASGRASRNGVCLSLSFPGVEDTFKIFQFRVFESAVLVGTSDARKNAATKVRRQQRARATGGVRRETPSRQSRKSGDGEERARKRVLKEREKKTKKRFSFLQYDMYE